MKRTYKVTTTVAGKVLWTCFMTCDEYERYLRKRAAALSRQPYIHPMPDEGELHLEAGPIEIGVPS